MVREISSTFHQGSDTEEILIYRSSDVGGGLSVIDNQMDLISETGFGVVSGFGVFAWAPESNGLYYTKTVSKDSKSFWDAHTFNHQVSLKRGNSTCSASDTESGRPKILWHKIGTPQGEAPITLPRSSFTFDNALSR